MTAVAMETDTIHTDASFMKKDKMLKIWNDTTHQYLYDKSSSICKKCSAISVLIFQIVIYLLISYLSVESIRDQEWDEYAYVMVDLEHRNPSGKTCIDDGETYTVSDFACSNKNDDFHVNAWGSIAAILICCLLIIIFLTPQIIKACLGKSRFCDCSNYGWSCCHFHP
eukprot:595968_1